MVDQAIPPDVLPDEVDEYRRQRAEWEEARRKEQEAKAPDAPEPEDADSAVEATDEGQEALKVHEQNLIEKEKIVSRSS